jgi:hypothetical protein
VSAIFFPCDSDAWIKRDHGTSSSTSVPRTADRKFKKVNEVRPVKFNTFLTLERLMSGSLYEIRLYMRNESGAGVPGKVVKFEAPMFGDEKKSKTVGGGGAARGCVGALGRQALREQQFTEDDDDGLVDVVEKRAT